MPSASKIDEVLAAKPVTFRLKTSGGAWQCQIHPNRAAYEKSKDAATAATPGISRTDSGLSISSSSSAGSSASSH
ncbi:hypothetical protein F5Y17DRAFT_456552 [Xylariaceae sp. FL0594]|nr:hypothetical protein F5Y17DRAFT_456552 [Xylariaceae sp. FL0594]